jgi:WD40 repeat protein
MQCSKTAYCEKAFIYSSSLALSSILSLHAYTLLTNSTHIHAIVTVCYYACTVLHCFIQAMAISWKEHRGAVTCVKVSTTNEQCVTSSEDGSCIVWDLDRGVRLLAMFEPTVFKSIVYHPDESQYLTCGSNHKITYWDAYDGSAIREIDGGEEEMNALDVDRTGACFVSGGDDALVKVSKRLLW